MTLNATDYKGYGYWWWLTSEDYQARGWGGQTIVVNPIKDTVIVFTAADHTQPYTLLQKYIYPAVKAEQALPPNPSAVHELHKAVADLSVSKPEPGVASPNIIKQINGKTYYCQDGIGLKNFSLSFKGKDCLLKYQMDKYVSEFRVGLDGAYIITPLKVPVTYFGIERYGLPLNEPGDETYQVAFRGKWVAKNVYLLEWLNYIEDPVKYMAKLTFEGKKVSVETNVLPANVAGTYFFTAERRD